MVDNAGKMLYTRAINCLLRSGMSRDAIQSGEKVAEFIESYVKDNHIRFGVHVRGWGRGCAMEIAEAYPESIQLHGEKCITTYAAEAIVERLAKINAGGPMVSVDIHPVKDGEYIVLAKRPSDEDPYCRQGCIDLNEGHTYYMTAAKYKDGLGFDKEVIAWTPFVFPTDFHELVLRYEKARIVTANEDRSD